MSLSVGVASSYSSPSFSTQQSNKPGTLSAMRAAQRTQQAQTAQITGEAKAQAAQRAQGCQTCKARRYQDESDDPGVSFQSATSVSPQSALSAVAGHEQEHVSREQSRAQTEGREVVFQSVTLHGGICTECGKNYVAGGTTRTLTQVQSASAASLFRVGLPDENHNLNLQA